MTGSDVFISYASADRPVVRPFVEGLEAAGLSVWWDQAIDRGGWGDRINAELAGSRTVLAFISRAAMASGFVFAEARRASELNKLIPVRIENEPLRLEFEGLVALIQNHFFLEPLDTAGESFRRLCAACRGDASGSASAPERDEYRRAAEWFATERPISDVSMLLAIATLENAPYATIELAARLLGDILEPPEPPKDGNIERRRGFALNPRSRRLGAVEAECFRIGHERLKLIDVECARFTRPERAPAVLKYAWRELDGIREPLCTWLNLLAAQPARQFKILTGVAVGKLAQTDFMVVYDRLILPWAMDADADRRETADMALSIAAFEPRVCETVEPILDGWAAVGASREERRAAAEFCSGYTGARLPAMSLPLLKTLIRRGEPGDDLQATVDTVSEALYRLVGRALQDEDSSLFDIDALLDGLAAWIGAPEAGEDPRFAIHFFLCILEILPLRSVDSGDRFSLAALLDGKRARAACLQGIAAALAQPELRDRVRQVVNRWIGEKRGDLHDDPLGLLAAALSSAATTPRDRSRIEYLFRHAHVRDARTAIGGRP